MTSEFRTYTHPLSGADRAEIEVRARAARAEASAAFFQAIGRGIGKALRAVASGRKTSPPVNPRPARVTSFDPCAPSWSQAARPSLP